MKTHFEISTDEPKKRLQNLQLYFPGATNKMISDFGIYLANRLNSHLTPIKFMRQCAMALYDLERGVDGYEETLISSPLVGLSSSAYTFLCKEIPNIAEKIFPPDFAREVRSIIEKIYREADNKYRRR